MAIATAHSVGKALLEALGIAAQDVTAVEISVKVNEVVTVKVTQMVRQDAMDALIEQVTDYKLVPKGEG